MLRTSNTYPVVAVAELTGHAFCRLGVALLGCGVCTHRVVGQLEGDITGAVLVEVGSADAAIVGRQQKGKREGTGEEHPYRTTRG